MLFEGFRDVDRTGDNFSIRCDPRGRILAIRCFDICSGTLLTLSLSLKIDQNRLGFSLISCSNDLKNFVRLSRIMCLTVDRNCLSLVRKQGWRGRMLYLLSYSFLLSYHLQDISSYPKW